MDNRADATGKTWALVLAAGDGTRLRTLTTTADGDAVPKQFCSLRGGPSLLEETLERAAMIADRERICTVVARQHRRWWEASLRVLPHENVIVQPENRGTGNGILLPLLHILERDPEARIVLLPSDHHVRDERSLAHALVRAVSALSAHKRELVLLGIEPDEIDAELGYIVPGEQEAVSKVGRFVEKPSYETARQLIAEGALWNAFILAAHARTLVDMYADRYPTIVADMRAVVAHDSTQPREPIAASHLYKKLPSIDFSRDIAQGGEQGLRVLRAPACGWSDLGTPARVAKTLQQLEGDSYEFPVCETFKGARLNLADQCARLGP